MMLVTPEEMRAFIEDRAPPSTAALIADLRTELEATKSLVKIQTDGMASYMKLSNEQAKLIAEQAAEIERLKRRGC